MNICPISGVRYEAEETPDLCLFNHQLVDLINLGLAVFALDGTCRVWNPAMAKLTGIPADSVVTKKIHELHDGFEILQDLILVDVLWRSGKGESLDLELSWNPHQTQSRSKRILLQFRPIRDAALKVVGSLLVIQDLTSFRQAEEQLKKHLALSTKAQEVARIGTFDWNIVDDVFECSPMMQEILGVDDAHPHTYAGWEELLDPDYREVAIRHVKHIFEHGLPFDLDYKIVRKSDRASRWVYGRGEVQYDGMGTPLRMLGTIQDITPRKQAEEERRKLESEVQHAQKLESLGALAGGMAHDMNNTLGAIMMVASGFDNSTSKDQELLGAMRTVENACRRGRDMVNRLLAFSRKRLEENETLDLNELIKEQAELLRHTTLQKVEVRTDLALYPCFVKGDASAITQAIMNLCVNSLDAMPEGGTIVISTRRVPGCLIELTVVDTGCGMSHEVREKALHPYFTTKPEGKGTGLGLSLVYGIVTAHGGDIDLRSKEGKGTEITLRFPAMNADGELDHAIHEDATLPGVSKIFHRILFVDDDDLLRATVPPVLAKMGHQVRVAKDGLEGLQMLEDQPVDLVILDLNMPGLHGLEVFKRIRMTHPRLRVLISTGYKGPDVDSVLKNASRVATLLKPYSAVELRSKIEAMQ